MTKKDYQLIATDIKNCKNAILNNKNINDNEKIQRYEAIQTFQIRISNSLKIENLKFDVLKFDEACLADNTKLFSIKY
jgi:hypothetical protein